MHKKQQYFIRTLLFSASMSLMYQVAWANETDAVINETEAERLGCACNRAKFTVYHAKDL